MSETSNAKKAGYVDNGWPQSADGSADHAVNELAAPVVGALSPFGELVFPKGIERIEDFPNLFTAMQRKRWPSTRIERVLGQNWLRLLGDVW